jgi:hypothetical protein
MAKPKKKAIKLKCNDADAAELDQLFAAMSEPDADKNNEVFVIREDDRESVKILIDAAKLQRSKGADYNGKFSSVSQAMYYRRGLDSILDIIHAKYLRIVSVMEAMERDPNYKPNFESLDDSFIDLCNYSSFGASWCRGKVPGQNPNNDLLNRLKQ